MNSLRKYVIEEHWPKLHAVQHYSGTCNWQQTFSNTKSPFLPIDTHTATMSLLTARYSTCCDVCLMCVNIPFAYISCRPLHYCFTCPYHIIHKPNRYHTITIFFWPLRHPNAKYSTPIVSCLHLPFPFPLNITKHIRCTKGSCQSVRVCSSLCTGVPLLTS
jgi:hypothetical protein